MNIKWELKTKKLQVWDVLDVNQKIWLWFVNIQWELKTKKLQLWVLVEVKKYGNYDLKEQWFQICTSGLGI